ncbi:MAG: HlyD family efflux transporter periplasmic adaptor subunit [Planctomycetota bacterium]
MTATNATRRTKSGPIVAASVILAAVIGGAAYMTLGGESDNTADQLTFVTKRGPMVVTVSESGTIKAAEQIIIKNEIEGQTTILTLAEEGSQVEEGDLLAELDVSQLSDRLVDQEIAVQNADAAYVRATENLAVAENQAKADVSKARLDFDFAVEDRKKYVDGEYPKLLMEAENAIVLAEEEFERAKEKVDGSQRLFDESFISETELKADQLSLNRAEVNLMLSREDLKLLNDYTYKRQVAQLDADVEQAELALERTERKARADVVQAEADVRAKSAELERQKSRLVKIKDQISKGKIYAPRGGLVVYATTGRGGGWRGNQEPLAEGQQIRERQELIYLPTATDRVAEIKVHESSLDQVRIGLPVRITIDALPGSEYWGRVSKIAPLPDATSSWLNPDLKVYNTEITITGNGDELRTGMSCRAEIIVENFDEATYVPVQSVVRVAGQPTAFVMTKDGEIEQRSVEVGLDNNTMIVITDGLNEGEKVMLAPPLDDTGTTGAIDADAIPAEQREAAEQAKSNPTAKPAESDENANAQQRGGQRGGMPDADTMAKYRKAQQELEAKMTDEEKAEFKRLRDDRDFQGMMRYGQEMAKKYNVEMPSFGGGGR